jgi:hypothetical protein
MLRLWIDPDLGAIRGRAAATLEQLLELAGWRSTSSRSAQDADVIYGATSAVPKALPCAGPRAWNILGTEDAVTHEGYRVPRAAVLTDGHGRPVVDPVLAGYFFLSGRIEHDSHARTFAGIPEQDTIAEWHLQAIPVVQRLVDAIATRMPSLPTPQPRWPRGKRWAMCLTHDCDRLLRFRTRGFGRDVLRNGTPARERLSSAAKALYSAIRMPRGTDPYEASLLAWLRFERSMGVRGAYFLGTWSRHDRPAESYDLVYARSDPETLRVVDACKEHGAELGLHSGIGAWRDAGRYAEEVRRFRESYGITPQGVRGHYWSLNPDNPEESLAFAARHAGLKYDTSFGMNTAYGFRRGTCYPFRPFDASTGAYSGMWELPPSVMDGGLHASAPTNEERIAKFAALAASVKSAGGVLVLDWHSDSLWDGFMDNMTHALLPELASIIGDASCWVVPSSEVIAWCGDARWQEPARSKDR